MDALAALGAALAAVLLLPVVITLAQELATRVRYGHIPGPKARLLTGNINDMLQHGMLACVDSWIQQYGPLTAFRLMGRVFVLVADPDAARQVMHKVVNHAVLANPNSHLMTGELAHMDQHGLLMAKDDTWRTVRNAWQPAFSSASLRNYQTLMDREARVLTGRLAAAAAAAAAAGGAHAIEVLSEVSRMTLAVVGTVAYGVDFNSPQYGGGRYRGDAAAAATAVAAAAAAAASAAAGGGSEELSLVQACRDWFATMAPSARSRWAAVMAIPCLLPALKHVACALPDRWLAMHIRARRVLRDTSRRLIADWRARETANRNTDISSDGTTTTTKPPGDSAAPAAAGGGVAPGSFLGLLLAARDRASGQGLTDAQIDAQVQTFILAGYETTANALTFSIFLLAAHPDKADALRAELDAVLPPLPTAAAGTEGASEAAGRASEEAGASELTPELLDRLPYTEAVVQEALRMYPPAHATSRFTDKPMRVLGYDIPVGTTLMIPFAHMHRKGGVWPQPEEFHPERFLPPSHPAAAPQLAPTTPHAHAPFGSGTRLCIGHRFAMQEAKTVLARLHQRLVFELEPGQVPLQVSAGLTMAPKGGVRARVRVRQP